MLSHIRDSAPHWTLRPSSIASRWHCRPLQRVAGSQRARHRGGGLRRQNSLVAIAAGAGRVKRAKAASPFTETVRRSVVGREKARCGKTRGALSRLAIQLRVTLSRKPGRSFRLSWQSAAASPAARRSAGAGVRPLTSRIKLLTDCDREILRAHGRAGRRSGAADDAFGVILVERPGRDRRADEDGKPLMMIPRDTASLRAGVTGARYCSVRHRDVEDPSRT